ncbi:preprotein translocase subunit SecG [Nitrosomonas sp. Nm166]|uniref:preprotein translocase subunit SecG n=1 Tax=Nitrosomonas sp. Nm166 TaxID=1881054 RepID=UPI0008E10B9C|nr:preprotein translocase subunit SecG [Nitrosomonas sp. Nm166]SFF07331.1 preprotein translocase subunit SecG [Nitrosomonas sp. Nm166]
MEILVWTVHVLLAIVLIALVLLQHGKGADMGAAFGSGSAGSLFGASGSANFLSRATSLIAAMFFATSMSLTYFSANQTKDVSVMSIMDQAEETDQASADLEKKSAVESDVDVPAQSNSKVNQIPE